MLTPNQSTPSRPPPPPDQGFGILFFEGSVLASPFRSMSFWVGPIRLHWEAKGTCVAQFASSALWLIRGGIVVLVAL